MNNCNLCPHDCQVDRTISIGKCHSQNLRVARVALHKYEEPFITGENGSGTIFFCGCNLSCVFCQNFCVSRNETGKYITCKELADYFKKLEDLNAHNINLVTPTHFSDKIIEALNIYKPKIPIIYNSSGYEKIEILKKLEGFIDVYLPDFKYYSAFLSNRFSNVSNYYEIALQALLEMKRQCPENIFDNGLIQKGLVIRHLILPFCSNDSLNILNQIEKHFGNKTYLSLMAQYTPYGNLDNFKEINRKLTLEEYERVIKKAEEKQFVNVYLQDLSSSDTFFIPPFFEENF